MASHDQTNYAWRFEGSWLAHHPPIVSEPAPPAASLGSFPMPKHLHLTHPKLAFWVTVEIHERDGRFMATADRGEDSRDIGVGDTPEEAVRDALSSLGEPYASEMAEGVVRRDDRREERAPDDRLR